MSAQIILPPQPLQPAAGRGAWPQRLALTVLLFLGACLAYLPYTLYPYIAEGTRPFLWGGITLALLATALLARRSARFAVYWVAIYAFFVASAANLADWYLNNWLPQLLGVAAKTPAFYGVAMIESTLVIVVAIVLLIKLAGGDLASLLLKRGKMKWWLPIGLLGFAFFAITVIPAATYLFGGKNVTWERILPWTPWLLLFVLGNGLREELWFRGLMLPRFKPLIGATPTLIASSLVFSLAHSSVTYTPMLVIFLFITFGLGMIFATIADETDSLWGAVLVHAGADIPVIVGILSAL